MKMIPGWPERFPAAITAIAQPPTGHQRTHREKQHPPNTLSSSQLKALVCLGIPVCFVGLAGQCLGVHLLPEHPKCPSAMGGCPIPQLSLGLCLGAGDTPAVLARALTLSGGDEAGSEAVAQKLFL